MARSKRSKKRSAPKRTRRRAPRVVTKFRTRTIVKRSRSRGGSSGGGIFVSRAGVVDTLKANAVPAAVAAASLTVGATVAGMLARRLAPRLGGNPIKVGGAVAVLGVLLATMARKMGAGAGIARAAQFAGLGIVTDGLMRATSTLRGKLSLPAGSPAQTASSSAPTSQMRGLPGYASQPSTNALLARMAG